MVSSQCGQLRSYRGLVAVLILGVAVLLVRPSWAATPLRVYATESNRETAVTSLSERERLVDLSFDPGRRLSCSPFVLIDPPGIHRGNR